jgi:hypothetical protein
MAAATLSRSPPTKPTGPPRSSMSRQAAVTLSFRPSFWLSISRTLSTRSQTSLSRSSGAVFVPLGLPTVRGAQFSFVSFNILSALNGTFLHLGQVIRRPSYRVGAADARKRSRAAETMGATAIDAFGGPSAFSIYACCCPTPRAQRRHKGACKYQAGTSRRAPLKCSGTGSLRCPYQDSAKARGPSGHALF